MIQENGEDLSHGDSFDEDDEGDEEEEDTDDYNHAKSTEDDTVAEITRSIRESLKLAAKDMNEKE